MADRLVPAAFTDLQGFASDHLLPALQQMRDVLSLQLGRNPALGPAQLSAEQIAAWAFIEREARSATTESDARTFIETHFNPWRVVDEKRPEGLFTGYFEPQLLGSRHKSASFPHPVYAKPGDLVTFDGLDRARAGTTYGKWVGNLPEAYDSREEIDRGSLSGRARVLCYVRDIAELFFMQVQGSGRVLLDSGETLRLGYAGKSGRAYQSIGAVLLRENQLTRENISMQTIKKWISENPERRNWLLWQNPSYVFFQELDLPDPARGSLGAAGVQLVPERSLAIDKTRYAYGTPVFLSTTLPDGEPVHRLMVAADTGSAILGAARGDVYFGWGDRAEHLAGHMKQPGEMHVLLPKRI